MSDHHLKFEKFEETLNNSDYGLVITKEGMLKGIWVSQELQDKPYPLPLEIMCRTHFGVDINEPEAFRPGLH